MARKVIIQAPHQNPEDSEEWAGLAFDVITRERNKNRLSVEKASSLAIRCVIIVLGLAACVMIFFVVYMYSFLLIGLTKYFLQNTSMLIDFLEATWRTITSASAAAVPFLIYLLRKQTKER